MKSVTMMLLLFLLSIYLFAEESEQPMGYLTLRCDAPMLVTLNDSLEVEAPADKLMLPAGVYHLRAVVLNERNWYSKAYETTVMIWNDDTVAVDLMAAKQRLLQSLPGDAAIFSATDSLIGRTPHVLTENEWKAAHYLRKTGFLKQYLSLSGETSWPVVIELQREGDVRQPIVFPSRESRPSLFKRYLKPGLVVTAISANWLSFYLKRQADDYYDRYQTSSDISRINRYYDKTQQYDTISNVLLGVSTAATVSFLYLLLTDE